MSHILPRVLTCMLLACLSAATCPPLHCHTESFPSPNIHPCSSCLTLPPPPEPLATTDLFTVPIVLPYSSFPLVLLFFKVILAYPSENPCFQGSVGTTAAPILHAAPLRPSQMQPRYSVAGPPCLHLECIQSVDLCGHLHGFLSLGSAMGFHQERGGFRSSSHPPPSAYSHHPSVPTLPFYIYCDFG